MILPIDPNMCYVAPLSPECSDDSSIYLTPHSATPCTSPLTSISSLDSTVSTIHSSMEELIYRSLDNYESRHPVIRSCLTQKSKQAVKTNSTYSLISDGSSDNEIQNQMKKNLAICESTIFQPSVHPADIYIGLEEEKTCAKINQEEVKRDVFKALNQLEDRIDIMSKLLETEINSPTPTEVEIPRVSTGNNLMVSEPSHGLEKETVNDTNSSVQPSLDARVDQVLKFLLGLTEEREQQRASTPKISSQNKAGPSNISQSISPICPEDICADENLREVKIITEQAICLESEGFITTGNIKETDIKSQKEFKRKKSKLLWKIISRFSCVKQKNN